MHQKKRVLLAVGVIASFLIALLSHQFVPLVPFDAVFHDGSGEHRLINRPLRSNTDVDAVAVVLEQYAERYWRVSDNTLLVTLELWRDRQRRWNYTSKAGL